LLFLRLAMQSLAQSGLLWPRAQTGPLLLPANALPFQRSIKWRFCWSGAACAVPWQLLGCSGRVPLQLHRASSASALPPLLAPTARLRHTLRAGLAAVQPFHPPRDPARHLVRPLRAAPRRLKQPRGNRGFSSGLDQFDPIHGTNSPRLDSSPRSASRRSKMPRTRQAVSNREP
jgi:hypothetical protein